jgi:parvulin-like peptidyl-prolyl isomerase
MPRFFREPLFQFLVIGAVVFALYGLVQGRSAETAPDSIVVSQGRVAQLAESFTRTWQRPPTDAELQGLIDSFVKEEIFYREGRKLGLDTDDTVFRRRLQQKMEFLMEPSEGELTPSEAELETYVAANRDKFRIAARVSFEQIYFDASRRGEQAEADAKAALKQLRASDAPAPESLGDATLLPAGMPLSPAGRIESSFGPQFADALQDLPVGEWAGPVRSTFGLHLVRIGERQGERDPEVEEVRDPVLREWRLEKRRAIADERYARLREGYEIVMEPAREGDAEKTASR